ncbi:hypothetical protein BDA96_05G208600 [Sorghum bicolor]|uniref:AAA+ ATPase domain-containing protein n=3 Tax=Sorghum bicolor TaxID=4558 RepID=C5Y6I7_SORBI|nr:disease resistance protein RPP13 [Sorghum bicolor]XP_021316860.1 disease resistance protein RPP13 [Sorghum bicolor]XP_021316861.1 disease resistance protein RPP13 [Sorghum bicolor]EES08872.1 hypothetical protein SORBI_3005G192100 [Sorghum bicolor]KAG0530688.1 hypothetical protein BDA96_05G208600 [Sorghum bicolor]KAG0530689.1 hypothetical protein BDA96_05G208600 [Sorghum bicolor]KAG0530691.1 hypothetical protein BDA96_05G208600 [Sorghum bicolor]KAG0530692.1 hypothetical protein BDA96_05G20|eukprot:XP_021316859.1 disease resistance protein RPP13 [Sorghum bicolor]
MEVVTGVLTGLVFKLGKLLVGEYNLQKGVKGEIMFLQPELQSMQGALKEISKAPSDELDHQDRIWASEVRELSYDIEDSIDMFVVRCEGGQQLLAAPDGMRGFIDRSLDLLTRFRVRRQVAMDIRDIKRRVIEARERREAYKIDGVGGARPDVVDPRLLAHYTAVTELVGIDDARDELIKVLTDDGSQEASKQHGRVVSIVGCGGLGKTTLANVVYQKIRTQFDCWAFVSVSQTPDMRRLFEGILSELGKDINEETRDVRHFIDAIGKFLQTKRYCIVIDDIWDISVWKMIRCALPDNMGGYVIITTTRNFKVAEEIGGAYSMKALCHESSRKLFYTRIFGNEEKYKCPDEHLTEVSHRILNKCAGVPLAIITIASLLANKARDKMEWLEVYNSIGTGLEDSTDVENMRKILAYSYYDLKYHLRVCLLYLSMFPEDYPITKNHLIWMWIAEGFVQCEQGKSLFELGECYFNELINTSMIQPVYDRHEAMIEHCRVHDMVLEVIRSLSNEDNFVTILNNEHSTSSQSKMFRRLSLQNSVVHLASPFPSTSMLQVRSVITFSSALDQMPALASFRVLRVLNLKGSYLPQGCDLKHLGNLFHLRYLGLGRTYTNELPEEIGNLRYLQTLDVVGSYIGSLPSTVVQLRHLMCLCVDQNTRVPNGIGRLTALEELSTLYTCDESTDIPEELCHLTELRVLELFFWNNTLEKSLVACLCKLRKIQSLVIWASGGEYNFDAWVAPRHVQRLQLQSCWFSRLPDWMNPSPLGLSFLWINVRELRQEDLETLGRLPALRHLYLKLDHEKLKIPRRFIVGACSFPCLVECRLLGFMGAVFFHQGAMIKLRNLSLTLYARDVREIMASSDGSCCFDLGLGNLLSLQEFRVSLFTSDLEAPTRWKWRRPRLQ